jgi:hypothetical protein
VPKTVVEGGRSHEPMVPDASSQSFTPAPRSTGES